MNRNISKGMKMSKGNKVRDIKKRELASNDMLLCQ
jgi:hypothetical protein